MKKSESESAGTGSPGAERLSGDSNESPSPTALAVAWAGRILGVSAIMVAPGLLGQWLDQRLGTGFFTMAGFGIGMFAGIGGLLVMTKATVGRRK